MPEQILIIESNTNELKKLREILSREGYSVITVTDAQSAVSITNKLAVKYVLSNTEVLDINKALMDNNIK